MKIKTSKLYLPFLAAISLGVSAYVYNSKASDTRLATVNYPDFMVEKLIRSNSNSSVHIESLPIDELDKLTDYDIALVRVHGASMNKSHSDALQAAIEKGVQVIAGKNNPEINTLAGRENEYIETLLDNASAKNNQSLFNYLRKHVDGKVYFNGTYGEPVYIPNDYFFATGKDQFFATFEEYDRHYRASGHYKEGAPRVALLMGNINLQNSNEEHIVSLINGLEAEGLNVYPISSFGTAKIGMVQSVQPNVIINNPHGRLLMAGAEKGLDLLRELNVPIVTPITLSEPHDKWMQSKQGMESGGMTSMSVVLPEMDGGIMPYAITAQFERNGRQIFDTIPGRGARFCAAISNYANLQRKANGDKRIAIYYYKGSGKGSITAESMEGLESLYNTLVMLRSNGYTVEGLPASPKELDKMIQARGAVLGTYALGAYDKFVKRGDPALVSVDEYAAWSDEVIPEALQKAQETQYGKAPGSYMAATKDGKDAIAVARLQFGNVAILPQPLPSVGTDVEKLVHGVAGAPAYPYVASYLWTRKAFKADALIHFGTHGSLEFIPGKQVALSNHDWSDLLVGDMPHFYIYTVNNIGEGIIAKRRSYATLVSHLTSPFMASETYGALKVLTDNIHKMEHLEAGMLKEEYRKDITAAAMAEHLHITLAIDSTKLFSDADIERVHQYLEEVSVSKVRDGLYTLGEAYAPADVLNTTRLMSIDPIKYSLANLDVVDGKIEREQMKNIRFIQQHYAAKANGIITNLLNGASPKALFEQLVSAEHRKAYADHVAAEAAKGKRMEAMMASMMAEDKKERKPFFDELGNLIQADSAMITDKEIDILIDKMKEKHGGAMMTAMLATHGKGMIRKLVEKMGRTKAEEMLLSGNGMMGGHGKQKEEEKKEGDKMSMMGRMSAANSLADKAEELRKSEIVSSVSEIKRALESVVRIKADLANSTRYEQEALLDALNGGYIEPSTAGDPVVNPNSVPTGKNFYGINPETTPSKQAWTVGERLANDLLAAEMKSKGRYPEKVSFTLWSSSFITSEGATVAQILHLLGVEPMRDGFGYIRSMKLIPLSELGRPRIDVVVQTSGQLRDIAASRLKLINDAVAMAAADTSEVYDNYVSKGLKDSEALLLEKGFSPVDARKYAAQRIFGGVNGNYGTGITGLVESGDQWSDRSQIAKQYINNMGAIYGSNGDSELWGDMKAGVFEAALLNTSVVVQPRSSNMWGPLSLDHVYEFMGGLSAAVEEVTGNDPTAYFNDYRNSNQAKVQELKEAIGVETASTVFNPKYIGEMLKGNASAYATFAETIRNSYGWNAMKPSAIDKHIWDGYYEVYVKDKYKLDIVAQFEAKNPYAMQELTAVMLESARKGMWQASDEQIKDIAALHTDLVAKHEAGCSGFICDNAMLRDYIAKAAPSRAANYQAAISDAREVKLDKQQADKSVTLKKEADDKQTAVAKAEKKAASEGGNAKYILIVLFLCAATVFIVKRNKRK